MVMVVNLLVSFRVLASVLVGNLPSLNPSNSLIPFFVNFHDILYCLKKIRGKKTKKNFFVKKILKGEVFDRNMTLQGR